MPDECIGLCRDDRFRKELRPPRVCDKFENKLIPKKCEIPIPPKGKK